MDIIERGIERYKLDRAPAKFNRVLADARHINTVPSPQKRSRQEDPALVVKSWRALPLHRRTVSELSDILGRNDDYVRRLLIEAGEPLVELQAVRDARKKIREEAARKRLVKAWHALPAAMRKVTTAAREAHVNDRLACRLLTEAGLVKPRQNQPSSSA
jgi:hypothetical protein